jgi:hypothetical protein
MKIDGILSPNLSIKATGNKPVRFFQRLVVPVPYFYRYVEIEHEHYEY